MIDYDDYKRYLEKIGFAGNSLNTYPSYISQNKLDIFDNIEGYQNLHDNDKLIKFSNEDSGFKEIFDKNHNFKSPDTFSDLRSGARRYKHYLQYKAVIKSMQEYDSSQVGFDLNGAFVYFSVFTDKRYPVKAICRKNIDILELEENFRTNNAKNILKKIFNMQGKENVEFLDEKEESVSSKRIHRKKIMTIKKTNLNQILYGPPGTGKTYNTINRALEIIDGKVPQNRTDAQTRFEDLSKAGQIEFVTFHQSYGYEEFVEGIKANTLNGNISYDIEEGIFQKLSRKAEKNYLHSLEKESIKKEFEEVFREMIVNKLDEKLKILTPRGYFSIFDINERTIFFEKNNGSQSHTLSIKTLKKMYDNGKNDIISGGLSVYYEPLLDILIQNSRLKISEQENLKNYILIIDEINRGNISKIFGELITLIEPSKRIGADEEIRLRLPYSNDEFGIPFNLYIIGTMNTADRSIALMDTALRRRFEFVEMMPDAELLDFEVDGINLKLLLEKINTRIEYLYDRDHAIGHAYFMELNEYSNLDELNVVMKNKIIPLLQEYFYDDLEKIRLILNDGFIEKCEMQASQIFAKDIDDEYIENEKFIYKVKAKFIKESYLKLCQNR